MKNYEQPVQDRDYEYMVRGNTLFGTMSDLRSLQVNPSADLDVEIFVASV